MNIQKIIQTKTEILNNKIESCLEIEKSSTITLSAEQLRTSKETLEKVRLYAFTVLVLKIVNFIIKIFKKKFNNIDKLLETNTLLIRSIHNYTELIKNPHAQIDDAGFTYDVSIERLKKSLPIPSDRPLKVTMVGIEYAGLVKQGGLAEAIEGLSQGLTNSGTEVDLVFPKYSTLPKEIIDAFQAPEVQQTSDGESYRVYSAKINGVNCQFIEHDSFELGDKNPSIYGPDYISQANRFASFSFLAADLIYKKKPDIIHLHDWHVAGVGIKLKKDHPEEWAKGEVPPVVFTFHNNQRAMQGRVSLGTYSYGPVVKGYQDRQIINHNDNLFVRTLMEADAITTVSESFAQESQQVEKGEGISFAVRQAARVGKLTGILNGANLKRWDPSTDRTLSAWKDIETGDAVDLSYSADSDNLMSQKTKVREQLQKWVKKHASEVEIDFSKPLVTYIGRFDSKQKGIDRLEISIEATLQKGGQFICMGSDEDPTAKEILDRLQKKYKAGVFFIRDYRDSSGKLVYQEGNKERPGIGSLIRAATDFTFIPSHFEPCGLVQFEGWQYGSLAIGAKTGGLADSINKENGFLFTDQPAQAIEEALEKWQTMSREEKETAIKKVMAQVKKLGWESVAEKYRLVYQNALKNRNLRNLQIPTIECLKHRKIAPLGNTESAEEHYLNAFYTGTQSSDQLSRIYRALPEKLRSTLPSPYGKLVDFAKYEKLGSFPDGRFAVSAPNAKKVDLILVSDDEQSQQAIPMVQTNGIWTAQVQGLAQGQKYQYQIDGQTKIDPYGRQHVPSKTDKKAPYSIVCNSVHKWDDAEWLKQRQIKAGKPQPMSIYEVHPITWKKKDGKALNYREFAHELLEHCLQQKYTHVELMGILEHPTDKSWGYQVSGYFAPTSRMGSVDDFKYLIDLLHKNKIGVLLDFVPAHFANDSFGLSKFDGSHQYDAHGLSHSLSIRNLFYSFGAKHFDFSRKEVREFLISSAMYWINEMHIDGIRVDCVSSMLYSEDRGTAELFLRDLNAVIHTQGKGAISIAEDFTGNATTTASPVVDGLDFDMKWHVSFMKYMFDYFNSSSFMRSYDAIRNAVDSDNFHKQVLFISHDQAVREFYELNQQIKDSKKEAQMRAMLSFMMCLPGKKLNFMATETATTANWETYPLRKDKGWFDEQPRNTKHLALIARLNEIYQTESAFYEKDDNGRDLEWIDDPRRKIHAFRRKNAKGESFICLNNFTKTSAGMQFPDASEIFNSDALEFGGNGGIQSKAEGTFIVPPMSTVILKEKSHGNPSP